VNGARRLIEALAEVVAANIAEERIERAILGARGAKPSRECGGASKAAQHATAAESGLRRSRATRSSHAMCLCAPIAALIGRPRRKSGLT
jgi:hypothetical protein